MKSKRMIKGIISYILALALAVIFALYLNANVGWFMLIALTLAPITSVFFAWLTSRCISVSCHMEECIMSKGDKCHMMAVIKNKSIFPTTPIEIVILNGDGVKSKEEKILCSVMPLSESKVDIVFEAKICGPSAVGLKEICVTDYLGIVSFKIKQSDYENCKGTISVIPDISDISIKDERILKIMQASMNNDDSEDTVESSLNTFGGFPGYDNREYVPGDPLKRINWKQSAKRDKLLVRLDDEMASKSVAVVLDSVFVRYGIDPADEGFDEIRYSYSDDEILPKLAEDAVENALGIVKGLILSGYTVSFYVRGENGFNNYQIEDDKDLENIRISMASYSFLKDSFANRFPAVVMASGMSGVIVSTPNSYGEVYAQLEKITDITKVSVFSSFEDIKNNVTEDCGISRIRLGKKKKEKQISKESLKDKVIRMAKPYIIPYLFSLVLSITVFSVFDVSPLSPWTILQMVVCALVIIMCDATKRNNILGGLFITIIVLILITLFIGIVIISGEYTQWFMSGGDLVENTPLTLISLVLVFTVFFTMVIFYYTCVYYRTSALLLVAMIPFVIYVKVIKDVNIIYVMAVVVLNVLSFLLNSRKQRDKDKRIVGNTAGVTSLILYGVVFVAITLVIPKSQDTKYYYIFEELFLGGNTTVDLPDEYKQSNEYSGNADGFNQLTNRKLYTVTNVHTYSTLYLRRQVFDYYDFKKHRWYKNNAYSDYNIDGESFDEEEKYLNNEMLADAFLKCEELSPGFLEKYGLTDFKDNDIVHDKKAMTIEAHNYESDTYITPLGATKVKAGFGREIYVTAHGIFGNRNNLIHENVIYDVEYYDKAHIKGMWISLGGSNLDKATADKMRQELIDILTEHDEDLYVKVVKTFDNQAKKAYNYKGVISDNDKNISSKVKELAIRLTAECKYDWEKAEALKKYFHNSGFVYDIEYDAPDDSVEYFLFNSKKGTCSDFATAYVLMARAAGLTARYVEGFVPEEEIGLSYKKEYVVRTKTSHAYPEVYIENLGYIVYEPTVAVEGENDDINGGFIRYILVFGYRILLVFAMISAMCIITIFVGRTLIPVIQEKMYRKKITETDPKKAVIMLYTRLVSKYGTIFISEGELLTPLEYADKFNEIVSYDIRPLVKSLERAVYMGENIDGAEVAIALDIYMGAKVAIKEQKKKIRKQRRNYGR